MSRIEIQPMETTMTLETARAILNSARKEQRTYLTGHEEAERLAFEHRMAKLRNQPFSWAPLSALVGAISLRRGHWE
jgi:hypothetical protein